MKEASRPTRFMGRNEEQWKQDLKAREPSIRRKAANVLAWLGEAALAPLLEALSDPDAHVREAAADSLGELGAVAAAPLARALTDKEQRVREGAARALTKLGLEAVPALLQRPLDPKHPLFREVLKIIKDIGPEAVPALLKASDDEGRNLRALAALKTLGREAVPNLIEALSTSSNERAERVLEAIAVIGHSGLGSLVRVLNEGSEKQRQAAIGALLQLGEDALGAMPDLRARLRSGDLGVRVLACLGLRRLGPEAKAARKELRACLKDRDELLRLSALFAIAAIDFERDDGFEPFRDLLVDLNPIVQGAAALALASASGLKALHLRPLVELLAQSPEAFSRALDDWDRLILIAYPQMRADFEARLQQLFEQAFTKLGAVRDDMLSALLTSLNDASAQACDVVMEALGELEVDQLPPLIEPLKGPPTALQRAVLGFINRRSESFIPHIVGLFSEGRMAARAAVLKSLQGLGKNALPVFVEALSDGDSEVREVAAECLGELGELGELRSRGDKLQPVVSELILSLRDKDSDVRRTAARSLAQMGSAAVPALRSALKHRDRRMRQGATFALRKMDPSGELAVDALLEALRESRWYIRRSALTALGRLGSQAKAACPRLLELLKDRDARTRFAAAEALCAIDPEQAGPALPLLMEALRNANIRSQAEQALEQVGARCMSVLLAGAEDPELSHAVERLLWTLSLEFLPELKARLSFDTHGQVQRPLSIDALAALMETLQHLDLSLRAFAAWALGCQEGEARAAIPELLKALNDEPLVRQTASAALGRIGHDAAPLVMELLASRFVDQRRAAIETLGRMRLNDSKVLIRLLEHLRGDHLSVEEYSDVASVLSAYGQQAKILKELIPAVLEHISQGHPRARRALLETLVQWGPAAVPVYLQAMSRESKRLPRMAVKAVRMMGERAMPALLEALADAEQRQAAALVLGLRQEPWLVRRRSPELEALLDQEAETIAPVLLEALRQQPESVWLANALAELGPPAVPTLIRALETEQGETRLLVALALARSGPLLAQAVRPLLASGIKGSNAAIRKAAALAFETLHRVGDEALEEIFEELCQNPRSEVRQWAMVALGSFKSRSLEALLRGLEDQHPRVRQSAAYALRDLHDDAGEVVPALQRCLKDDNEDVRWRAVGALTRLFEAERERAQSPRAEVHGGQPQRDALRRQALPDLLAALEDDNARVVNAAALALVELGTLAVPSLVALLDSPSEELRRWGTWSLGRIAQQRGGAYVREAVPKLSEVLHDSNPRVASSAAWTLGQIGEDARTAVPSLRESLTSPYQGLRWFSAFALGAIGLEARAAVPDLTKALTDDDEDVRRESALALVGMSSATDEQVLAVLLKTLETPVASRDSKLRQRALESLECLGPKAVPDLFEALKHKQAPVRMAAAIVLARVSSLAVEAVMPQLLDALGRDDSEDAVADLKVGAIRALEALGLQAQSATPYLLELLEDERKEVRAASIEALVAVAPPEEDIALSLADCLADHEPDIRRDTARALGALAPSIGKWSRDALLPKLIYALRDEDEAVCEAVVEVIAGLGRWAAPTLIKTLSSTDDRQARYASQALHLIGLELLPDLLEALARPCSRTRLRVAELITELWPVSHAAVPDLLDDLQSEDLWSRQNAMRLIEETAQRLRHRSQLRVISSDSGSAIDLDEVPELDSSKSLTALPEQFWP